jgi:flavin-dependent dehydrogenase
MSKSYDAIVIGGGPGGSTVSTMLAMAGRRVLLLEREKFPRYHIGESLLAGTADLMNKMGVLEKVEKANYVKKLGVTWLWGAQREPWTVYFKDALATPYDHGYQVERGQFDKLLLDNSREKGVEALDGHAVTKVLWDDGRVTGVEYESVGSGVKQTAEAPWTIDASGQTNFITSQVAQKTWDDKLKNMAIWCYWKNAERLEGIDAGNIFLPAFSDGWWWFIPLRDQITSIGAVLDRDNYLAARDQGLREYYVDAIQRTPALAARLRNAEMVDTMRVTKDWSYTYDSFSGKGFVAVGDAACFIDPLLSTGVHLAMLSGFLAAVSVNTLIDEKPEDERSILSFYQEQYTREYGRLRDQVYFLYNGHRSTTDSYFWHARKTMDMPSATPKEAFVSLIAGAFEHRAWFRTFLNNLDVNESLKKIVAEFFKTGGPSAAIANSPLVKNPGWREANSYAIDGLRLRPAEILTTGSSQSLPLTEHLKQILSQVDGRKNGLEIVQAIGAGGNGDAQSLEAALKEAVMHGAIVPAPAGSQS